MENNSPRNGNQTEAGVAILIKKKVDSNPKTNKRQKRELYNDTFWSIHQKDMPFVNVYAPIYTKQILRDLNREKHGNTIKVENFNTSLSVMGRSSRKKKSITKH